MSTDHQGTPPKSKSSENFKKFLAASKSADDPAAALAPDSWSTFAVGGEDEAGGLVLDDVSGMHDTLSTSGSESELSMPLDVSPLTVETSTPQPPEGRVPSSSPTQQPLISQAAVAVSDKKNV